MRLRAALERLTHTAVRTNIRAQRKKKAASFHWLESWTVVTDEKTG
jgi:plasmid replication initiation protein